MKGKKNSRRTAQSDSVVGKRGEERANAETVDKAQLESSSEIAAKVDTIRPFDVDAVHRFGKHSGSK